MKKIVSLVLALTVAASTVFASPAQQNAVSFEATSNEVILGSDGDLFASVNAMPLTLAEMAEVEGEAFWIPLIILGLLFSGCVGGCPTGTDPMPDEYWRNR
ncbi:MAG: hypothetical protein FWE09_03850 [Treponema sp.]|nr:hypothetical protein [Treponema sp.]